MMILYYTLTRYHQLASILHKTIYAPSEVAHLYLSNGNYIEKEYIERLKSSNIFQEVKILDDQPAWGMGAEVNFENEDKLYPVLENITELCYKSLVRPIEEYDEIYIMADHFPLGFVLSYKNIPFHYVEEAVGVHCCYELWMNKLLEQNNKFLYLVGKKIGFYGKAPCVIDCYVDVDKQSEDYKNDNTIDFSVTKLLHNLNKNELNNILKIFNIDMIDDSSDKRGSVLVLTEYLAGAKVCSLEEQYAIYGMFIDYFCKDKKVFLKPHPNDHQGRYKEWFPGIHEIDKSAPSELIPYCINKKFDRIISFCSTSYISLIEYTKEVYSFRNKDLRIEKLFKYMNKYYIATNIISKITGQFTVYGIGADSLQLKFFLKSNGINDIDVHEFDKCEVPCEEKRRIIVVDDLDFTDGVKEYDIKKMIYNMNPKDVIFFIDSKRDVLFFDEENYYWAKYTVPIRIVQQSLKSNIREKKEWIFMLTKDNEILRIGLNIMVDEMLKNTGIRIIANDNETTVKERVLEGMLYATEQKCRMLSRRR